MKDERADVLQLSDLRQMEIIDISEGKRLGFINDIIFDDDLKKIEKLVIPPETGFFSLFKKKDDIEISWDKIRVIGVDVILVELSRKNANDGKHTYDE